MSTRTFRWTGADGLVPGPLADEALLAADSWLVDDGRARALDRHRRRFADACGQAAGLGAAGPAPASLDAFWAAVRARLPDAGRWFPRVELSGDQRATRLSLRVRPAPPTSATVRVWLGREPDPRRFPRRKGPDLPSLARLRARASAAGADDALLVDADGVLLEAAHAGVLWWEGGMLCRPRPGSRCSPALPPAWSPSGPARWGYRSGPSGGARRISTGPKCGW